MVKKDDNGRVKVDLQTLISFLILFLGAIAGFYDLKTDVALLKNDVSYLKQRVNVLEERSTSRMAAKGLKEKNIN